MYHIIQDGVTVATVDRLRFWKRQKNGVNILCPEPEANGTRYLKIPLNGL